MILLPVLENCHGRLHFDQEELVVFWLVRLTGCRCTFPPVITLCYNRWTQIHFSFDDVSVQSHMFMTQCLHISCPYIF